jgi:hypothetical protein
MAPLTGRGQMRREEEEDRREAQRPTGAVPPQVAGVLWYLVPVRMPARVEMPGRQVAALAQAKRQPARTPGDIIKQVTRRVPLQRRWRDGGHRVRRAHLPDARAADIDIGQVRATMLRVDLAGLEQDDREVAVRELAQNLFNAAQRAPLLLLLETKDVELSASRSKLRRYRPRPVPKLNFRWPRPGDPGHSDGDDAP